MMGYNIIASKIKSSDKFSLFLQAHRYILEGTALEIQRNNTDVPFVDTILGRIRSTVYAFPYRPKPPPLPERKPNQEPRTRREKETNTAPEGKGTSTEPKSTTRPPRPPRPATRPPRLHNHHQNLQQDLKIYFLLNYYIL